MFDFSQLDDIINNENKKIFITHCKKLIESKGSCSNIRYNDGEFSCNHCPAGVTKGSCVENGWCSEILTISEDQSCVENSKRFLAKYDDPQLELF